MSDDTPLPPTVQRRPWWGWLLAAMCALIAIVAVAGQWILGIIGLGSALTVLNISKSTERTPKARAMACIGVTAVAWISFSVFTIMLANAK